jgi:hypothetical protein
VRTQRRHHPAIFISHASADIQNVRRVRNYLEDAGAMPLLFHLMSLKKPELFWPVIRREIESRSFFLYCESSAAEASEWVQRERTAVESLARRRPIRHAKVRVDEIDLDLSALDGFVRQQTVYVSYAQADVLRVSRILRFLREFDFEIASDFGSVRRTISLSGRKTQYGWYVPFLSRHYHEDATSVERDKFAASVEMDVVPILLEDTDVPSFRWGRTISLQPVGEAVDSTWYGNSVATPIRADRDSRRTASSIADVLLRWNA